MTILPGSPPVPVVLRRSTRARRFSLRVSRLDGRVTLSMPHWAPEAEALAFLRAQEGWIRAALARRPTGRRAEIGASLPVEGVELAIQSGTGRRVQIAEGTLWVPGDPDHAGARVAGFLKVLARNRLEASCRRHTAALGRNYSRISLRDTRSRWGSCSAEGALMFSWRLIMAPPAVLDYVAAHEVAHLAQMNHSPAFWAEVARLLPDHGPARRWLRDEGQALHAISFGD
ncbi:M48 family metallopeptidase [Thioclava sp. BHET1]|nr:M48 family metallopeptidase [Thioclava sp. BHET1]